MIKVFLQSLFIGYSGAVMPGSLLTYTIDKSLRHGAKSGLIISLGHILLELLLVIGIFFGLGKYLSSTPVQATIGLIGGIILIFLGGNMIKESLARKLSVDFSETGEGTKSGLLISGVVLSASNPYFLVWWAVIGLGLIISAYQAFGVLGILLFYLGHISADLSWYSFISVLVNKTKAFFSLRFYRLLVLVLGAFLVLSGIGFLLNSIKIGW